MDEARSKITQPPRSLTRKGRQTRAVLLKTAGQVFKELGYYATSVSEISRRAGVSQGTFYQYFKNKEQVFLELTDLIISRFWHKAQALPAEDPSFEQRLRAGVGLILEHAREHHYYHRMLGEFELIDPVTIGYYDSIARFYRGFFRREANAGHIRPLDPNLLAYGLMGMAIFHALEWGPEAEVYPHEMLVELTVDLLLKGISGPKPWKRPRDLALSSRGSRVPGQEVQEEELTQGQKTKRAIFQAAEEVLGQYGYNRAGISEITRRAGVAQGTFYIHFKSKRDLMSGFVKYLSHEMRRELKMATAHTKDRRDTEREGMVAFFRFLERHRSIYRVLPECETIGQDIAMWYYKKLAAGYVAGFESGFQKGEIRNLPVVFLVRSLMGFNHMIGLKWLVWNSSPQARLPRGLLREAISLVLDGLSPT